MKIAFTGWAGSGKTKASEYLRLYYDTEVISFADGIKFIDKYLFGLGKKERKRLQRIGEFFREIDPDIWVNRTMETIADEEKVSVDDARRLNEYEALDKDGFIVIRTVADENLRVQRLIERDGSCDVSLMYNDSERGMAHLTLREIENNGTLEEFYERIDTIMLSLGFEKNSN
jgi:dephospho-CoA kinase